jgi:hypothetical protein
MNHPNIESIARDAWLIYNQARNMQKIMLEVFFDEFITFEEEDRNLFLSQEELPF